MPTKYHLQRAAEDEYVLELNFLHNYDVLLAENYTFEVVLPYGASDITVSLDRWCLTFLSVCSLTCPLRTTRRALRLPSRLLTSLAPPSWSSRSKMCSSTSMQSLSQFATSSIRPSCSLSLSGSV